MAQDLMDRLAGLESAQVPEATVRHNADGASMTPWAQSRGKQQSLTEPSSVYQEGQNEVEEISFTVPHPLEEPCRATTSSSESVIAPGTQTPFPTWPWASNTPLSFTTNTPYVSLNTGLSNMP